MADKGGRQNLAQAAGSGQPSPARLRLGGNHMIIESQLKRLWWRNLAIGFLVDVAIAIALAWAIADEGDRLESTLFIWLGIQAVSILFSLRAALQIAAAWQLGHAEIVEEGFLAQLQKYELPRPDPYEASVPSYLDRLIEDEDLPVKARIGAAIIGAMQATLIKTSGLIKGTLFGAAYERALQRYRGL
jgi:hypothetical protein